MLLLLHPFSFSSSGSSGETIMRRIGESTANGTDPSFVSVVGTSVNTLLNSWVGVGLTPFARQ